MSVDKFGHFSKGSSKGVERGPPGHGFNLTFSGDYDIQEKRIINLREPLEKKDATTKSYVEYEVKKVKDITDNLKNEIDKCANSCDYVESKLEELKRFFSQIQKQLIENHTFQEKRLSK